MVMCELCVVKHPHPAPRSSPSFVLTPLSMAGMMLVLTTGVSGGLVHAFPEIGMAGSWQESAPSTHAERLAEFAFHAVQGAGFRTEGFRVLGAEIVELTSYSTQVLAA